MPTINQLSSIGEVTSADQIPTYDESNGDTRKMSVLQLQDYLEENLNLADVNFLQAGTGAVERTVQSKLRDVVSVKDFGAVGDGVTDDTAALQNWANRAGMLYLPDGTYKITSTITLSSGSRIIFSKNAIIQTDVTNISLFSAASKSKIQIEGGKFKQTAAGTSAYVAAIKLSACSDCFISGCIFEGMQWAGVMLDGCSQCVVSNNYFTGWLGTNQDAADVCLYNLCTSCEISSNMCYGGGHSGILVQDPYAGLIPSKNLIFGNRIGQHTAYGIAVYLPGTAGSGNTYNQVINNYIENILGTYSTNRSSGAGIYVVGNWAGGTQIIGNNIYNCCQQTLDRTLTPAGVGVGGIASGVAKPIISNNTVTGMSQGDGILVSSSPGGAVVSSNVIRIPSTNNGAGAGGGTLLGSGIRIENTNNIESDGNNVIVSGSGSAAYVFANATAISDVSFSGGYYESPTAATFLVSQSGSVTTTGLMISNVRAKQTGSNNYAFSIASVVNGFLSNNYGSAVAFEGLRINASTQVRVIGGSYTNASFPSISTVGVCTGTLIDSSVYFGTSSAAISNSGTGAIVSWRSSASPSAGDWAVGDRTEQSVPVVGNPKGWRCTVAGSPGTWVSEGNL